jgi:hypothetical protein
MNEKMTTEQFLQNYANNLLKALIDGKISFSYLTIECEFCPLRAECEKDSEENPGPSTCEEFFQKFLADGKAFRKK